MIKDKCFTGAWLDSFKGQKEHNRIDKIILEKMIYALHLLGCLKSNGLPFVFKGGTSLLLLLKEGNRFSIDIDIICNTERTILETILEKVIKNSIFDSYELDNHRSYKKGIPKAHYAFSFTSAINNRYSGKILLDILIEDSIYPELVEKNIQTKWIETDRETVVTVPTIDSITGDKLTAFAPNTVGIPYFKGTQSFAMEVCKQLFDLSKLFEHIQNMETVAKSFHAFAKQEIKYRNLSEVTQKVVLKDIIDTCVTLAKRGAGTQKEKRDFIELQKGIKSFGSGYLMKGNFRIDDALAASARIAYLASKLWKGDTSPVQYFENQEIKDLTIEVSNWNFLSRLKKHPDKSIFYYWFLAVKNLPPASNPPKKS